MASLAFGFVVLLAIGGAVSTPAIYTGEIIETDTHYGPIKKCARGLNDEELSACLTDNVKSMGQMFADGIPEIDLKTFDPYTTKRFDYTLNLRPVIATTRFSNVVVRGLSAFDQAHFKLDTKGRRMSFKLGSPAVRAEANYELIGNIPVLFQMIGNGPCSVDITNGVSEGEATFKIGRNAQGKEVLQVDELQLSLDYEDSVLQIGGLFNRHPTLKRAGPLINRLANQYQHELFEIIKPELDRQVAEIVKEIMNNSFANMPFMAEFF